MGVLSNTVPDGGRNSASRRKILPLFAISPNQDWSGWMSQRAARSFAVGCLFWQRLFGCLLVRRCASVLRVQGRAARNGARKRNLPGSLLLGLV